MFPDNWSNSERIGYAGRPAADLLSLSINLETQGHWEEERDSMFAQESSRAQN